MILIAAIQSHDLGAARDVAADWDQSVPGSAAVIVGAFLDASQTDESIAFARRVSNPVQRASALFAIARQLLNRAGAPEI